MTSWEPESTGFHYDDASRTRVELFRRTIRKGETLQLPRGNWTGCMLILPLTR
jgi:hypothetical protein